MQIVTVVDERDRRRALRDMRSMVKPLLVVWVAGCAPTIPNVRPFAAETASLYQANDRETQAVLSQYDEASALAQEVLQQSELRLPDRGPVEAIRDRLQSNRASFAQFDRAFDAVLQQAVAYSERLAELAAAGEMGEDAAKSLATSINQFGELTGVGGVITGPIATVVNRIADYYTRMEARASLHDAVVEAQPAVDLLDSLLIAIHAEHLQTLVSTLVSDQDALLLYEAGPSITGYFREANERRDQFYRRALLTLRLNDDGISGFCRDPSTAEVATTCINLKELEALREVEERLATLRPEFEAYEEKRAALRAWRARRRSNGARIVKAVSAWAKEHARLVHALKDGSGVSAFSLRAIVAEIRAVQN